MIHMKNRNILLDAAKMAARSYRGKAHIIFTVWSDGTYNVELLHSKRNYRKNGMFRTIRRVRSGFVKVSSISVLKQTAWINMLKKIRPMTRREEMRYY